ncbi:MAG: T9SS type A sorting domain-containing protein [Flavobacterium sp.]|nr:T9SS type A sorting domain-containing protein [Flavobacterium sp.]
MTGITTTALSPNAYCQSNGVSISVTGTSQWVYEPPTDANYSNCVMPASFEGNGFTTGNAPSGTATQGNINYFFNPAVYSATVTYTAVNSNDTALILINGTNGTNVPSPPVLTNLCNLTLDSNNSSIIHGNCGATYGDVQLTITSANPFSEISLVNIGGNTGWTMGNPCKFEVTPCPPDNPGPCIQYNIHTDPKSELHACVSGGFQDSFHSLLENYGGSFIHATINGVPANASNINIVTSTPLPNGYTLDADGFLHYIIGNYQYIDHFIFYYKLCSPDNSVCVGPIICGVSFENCTGNKNNHNQNNTVTNTREKIKAKLLEATFTPNPSLNGTFILSLNEKVPTPTSLEIYDETGKKIFSVDGISSDFYEFNLAEFSKGTYFAVLKNNNEFVTKKLIID